MSTQDNDPNENDNEGGDVEQPGKVLRQKYEQALAENKALRGENLLYKSGLGHLSAKQAKAVVTTFDGEDMTADALAAHAKELGYEVVAPSKPGQQTQQSSDGQTSDQSTNGQEGQSGQEGQQANQSTQSTNGDEQVTGALNNIEAIERANQQAQSNKGGEDFDTRLANASSQEEALAIIRQSGHEVGIVHEMDVE